MILGDGTYTALIKLFNSYPAYPANVIISAAVNLEPVTQTQTVTVNEPMIFDVDDDVEMEYIPASRLLLMPPWMEIP
jgi:hypothetical protein